MFPGGSAGEWSIVVTAVAQDGFLALELLHAIAWPKKKKKKGNNSTWSKMDGPRDYHLSEVIQRKTNILWYHLYVNSNTAQTYLPTKHI